MAERAPAPQLAVDATAPEPTATAGTTSVAIAGPCVQSRRAFGVSLDDPEALRGIDARTIAELALASLDGGLAERGTGQEHTRVAPGAGLPPRNPATGSVAEYTRAAIAESFDQLRHELGELTPGA